MLVPRKNISSNNLGYISGSNVGEVEYHSTRYVVNEASRQYIILDKDSAWINVPIIAGSTSEFYGAATFHDTVNFSGRIDGNINISGSTNFTGDISFNTNDIFLIRDPGVTSSSLFYVQSNDQVPEHNGYFKMIQPNNTSPGSFLFRANGTNQGVITLYSNTDASIIISNVPSNSQNIQGNINVDTVHLDAMYFDKSLIQGSDEEHALQITSLAPGSTFRIGNDVNTSDIYIGCGVNTQNILIGVAEKEDPTNIQIGSNTDIVDILSDAIINGKATFHNDLTINGETTFGSSIEINGYIHSNKFTNILVCENVSEFLTGSDLIYSTQTFNLYGGTINVNVSVTGYISNNPGQYYWTIDLVNSLTNITTKTYYIYGFYNNINQHLSWHGTTIWSNVSSSSYYIRISRSSINLISDEYDHLNINLIQFPF